MVFQKSVILKNAVSERWCADSKEIFMYKKLKLTVMTTFYRSHKHVLVKNNSSINAYKHSCLKPFSNVLKAMFKQPNSCSNHEIHYRDQAWFSVFKHSMDHQEGD